MNIKTSLELVRYIRHHLAGSEFQDVQAVEGYVTHRINLATEYLKLYNELLYAVENKYPNETRHQTALRLIKESQSNRGSGSTQTNV